MPHLFRFCFLVICSLACLCSCSRQENPPDKYEVSYVLTKPDGSKKKSKIRNVGLAQKIENAFEDLRPELSDASGAVVFRTSLGSKIVCEVEGTLVDGKSEGVFRTVFTVEGKRIQINEVCFLHDQLHGRYVAYYPDGTIINEGEWRNGTKNGIWVFNTKKIKPVMKLSFENDTLHGRTEIYNVLGAVVAQGEYKNGKPYTGSFISNPSDLMQQDLAGEHSFETTLSHYKDGQLIDSAPATIETGL